MERNRTFLSLGQGAQSLSAISTRLCLVPLLSFFAVFVVSLRAVGQDFHTVDDALPDFTEMSLEDLVEQDVTVRERLTETRKLTLQDGILGGHVHEAGEWMVGYRYMYMDMQGSRIGDNRVSNADVFAQGFSVNPTRMTMEMHMVHLM